MQEASEYGSGYTTLVAMTLPSQALGVNNTTESERDNQILKSRYMGEH